VVSCGIQVDVTDAEMLDVQANLADIHAITNGIRAGLAEELRALAVAGALQSNFEVSESQLCKASGNSTDAWCLLPTPTWREHASVIAGDVLRSGALSLRLHASGWHQRSASAAKEDAPCQQTAAERAKVWKAIGSLGAAALAVGVLQTSKGTQVCRPSWW